MSMDFFGAREKIVDGEFLNNHLIKQMKIQISILKHLATIEM
jgi:hypothetical protein